MFGRTGALIVHGVTAEEWCERYGIQPFTHPCCVCGRPCTTSIPFATGTLRGLMAPVCECGHPTPPYCIVRDPKFGDLFTGGNERELAERAPRKRAPRRRKARRKHLRLV